MEGRIRSKRKAFAQVSNEPLRNKGLSLKAKGLYALIESYLNIPNFILYKNTLLKSCKEGKSAFNCAWEELKDSGYLVQMKHKNALTGRFYYDYELNFNVKSPQPDFPHLENPPPGKAGCIIDTYLNNTDTKNTFKENNASNVNNDVMTVYFNLYEKHKSVKHPRINDVQYQSCKSRIEAFIDEYGLDDMENYVALVEEYLTTHELDTDHNINHFSQEQIMKNRYWRIM